ncbi:uncharacterized protein [Typha angustifolia]|uniref:uncharacterized protein n=1 Tax=Typha angustifolia TaxID=59011 RepID=UPI003C30C89D
MDKLLAMSILSSTPADIYSVSTPWLDTIFRAPNKQQNKGRNSADKEKKISAPVEKQQQQQQQQRGKAWFEPAFDGLNCFETLVSESVFERHVADSKHFFGGYVRTRWATAHTFPHSSTLPCSHASDFLLLLCRESKNPLALSRIASISCVIPLRYKYPSQPFFLVIPQADKEYTRNQSSPPQPSMDKLSSSWINLSRLGKWKEAEEIDGKTSNSSSSSSIEQEKRQLDESKKNSQQQLSRPRFAPEFDGINCFETLVSH